MSLLAPPSGATSQARTLPEKAVSGAGFVAVEVFRRLERRDSPDARKLQLQYGATAREIP